MSRVSTRTTVRVTLELDSHEQFSHSAPGCSRYVIDRVSFSVTHRGSSDFRVSGIKQGHRVGGPIDQNRLPAAIQQEIEYVARAQQRLVDAQLETPETPANTKKPCPVCGWLVEVHREGWIYDHEVKGKLCKGSGR
jgi:hypothetical protein